MVSRSYVLLLTDESRNAGHRLCVSMYFVSKYKLWAEILKAELPDFKSWPCVIGAEGRRVWKGGGGCMRDLLMLP